MSEYPNAQYGSTLLRVILGLLMVIPGLGKLSDPSGIIGMLGSLGFPAPEILGWILLLSEIVFGLAILIGFELKYTVWPPIVILTVALLTVHLPNIGDPMGQITIMLHLLGIASLLNLFLTGPGALAIKGKK